MVRRYLGDAGGEQFLTALRQTFQGWPASRSSHSRSASSTSKSASQARGRLRPQITIIRRCLQPGRPETGIRCRLFTENGSPLSASAHAFPPKAPVGPQNLAKGRSCSRVGQQGRLRFPSGGKVIMPRFGSVEAGAADLLYLLRLGSRRRGPSARSVTVRASMVEGLLAPRHPPAAPAPHAQIAPRISRYLAPSR